MADASCRLRFSQEPFAQVFVRNRIADHLQSDSPIQPRVLSMVDDTHTSFAKFRRDLVWTYAFRIRGHLLNSKYIGLSDVAPM
jgi:hypothetical protein